MENKDLEIIIAYGFDEKIPDFISIPALEKKYPEHFVNIKDAAKMLGVTANTLRNWEKSGKFMPIRNPINRYRMYEVKKIKIFLEFLQDEEYWNKYEIMGYFFENFYDGDEDDHEEFKRQFEEWLQEQMVRWEE